MNKSTEFIDLGGENSNVIGLVVSGKATADTISELVERIETIRDTGQKARIYLDLTRYDGFELSLVKEKLAHFSTLWNCIERCAYVMDNNWMSTAIGLVDAVTPMHLRAFSAEQDEQARQWVLERA